MKTLVNQRFINAVNYILEQKKEESKGSIAENLKIKPAKFSEILNNRMNVGIEEIVYFCDTYNFEIEYIITGNGEMLRDSSETKKVVATGLNEPIEVVDEKLLTLYKEKADFYEKKYNEKNIEERILVLEEFREAVILKFKIELEIEKTEESIRITEEAKKIKKPVSR